MAYFERAINYRLSTINYPTMTAKGRTFRMGAVFSAMILLYVGAYGPVRAWVADNSLRLHKTSEQPPGKREIVFDAVYAPYQWLPVDSALRLWLVRYTYFSYRAMYGHPAETWFL